MHYTWFQILWFFFLYGFLGWCCEVAFAAVCHGKFINRGFLNGPICSIYGFGVLSVLLVLEPLKDNLLILFLGSVVFTSLLEFLTGWVLEKLFHDKWWDYTNRPLNIRGYVCLEFSLAWGAACVFVVDVFHPLIVRLVNVIPLTPGWVLLAVFGAAWVADHIITIIEVCRLPKRLRALNAIEDALTAISDEIGENIYKGASGAKNVGEEVAATAREKARLQAEKNAAFRQTVQERNEELRQSLQEKGDARRRALEARRAELTAKREELLSRRSFVQERIVSAFPALRAGKTNGRAFTRLHEWADARRKHGKNTSDHTENDA